MRVAPLLTKMLEPLGIFEWDDLVTVLASCTKKGKQRVHLWFIRCRGTKWSPTEWTGGFDFFDAVRAKTMLARKNPQWGQACGFTANWAFVCRLQFIGAVRRDDHIERAKDGDRIESPRSADRRPTRS